MLSVCAAAARKEVEGSGNNEVNRCVRIYTYIYIYTGLISQLEERQDKKAKKGKRAKGQMGKVMICL